MGQCPSRHLRARGYRVTFVRNGTDVDDKIISRANECGDDPKCFAARWTAEYRRDYQALGCQPPDVEPLATVAGVILPSLARAAR